MMTANVELVASYWTLAGAASPHSEIEYSPFDFKDRVEAAARAGLSTHPITTVERPSEAQ